ncbi:polysaccharide deacetylase family protein [Halanaerobaculum tunisiense]
MRIELTTSDVLILCVILSVSFFLLGIAIDSSFLQETLPVTDQKLAPIYQVDTTEKKIAITLDGMWGADYTHRLLEIFRKHDIYVTFFFGGNWLEEYPDLVQEIVANGHEIGNHSYTHPHMTKLSAQQIKKELTRTSELIKKLTGQQPTLFRPPFGEYDNQLIKVAHELDYHVVQWTIDSLDWKDVSTDFIVNRVLENAAPGSIVLMHNNGTHTADALAKLIPQLKERGYEIVPVSELIYQDDYYVVPHSGLQKKVR